MFYVLFLMSPVLHISRNTIFFLYLGFIAIICNFIDSFIDRKYILLTYWWKSIDKNTFYLLTGEKVYMFLCCRNRKKLGSYLSDETFRWWFWCRISCWLGVIETCFWKSTETKLFTTKCLESYAILRWSSSLRRDF